MVVALTEVVPATVRTAGFSLAYSLATTLGGSSLAISTWLIERTGDKAAPGYWMSFAAVCGLVATLALYRGGTETSPQQSQLPFAVFVAAANPSGSGANPKSVPTLSSPGNCTRLG